MATTSGSTKLPSDTKKVISAGKLSRLLARLRRLDPVHLIAILLLTILAIIFIFPIYWMFTGSLKQQIVTLQTPPDLFPVNPTLENWRAFLFNKRLPVWRWFANSLIVSGGTTFLTVLFSSLAGYAFGKKRFPGSTALFWAMIATMMLPRQVILIPLFIIVRRLNMFNTYWGMIIPLIASPFGVFLIKQFMSTISNEIMDAARVDGVSEWGMYWRIILPLSTPALAALAIFTFSSAWNNFLWQLLMADNIKMFTLPVGLSAMSRIPIGDEGRIINIGLLMAGGTFGAIPMIIFFLIFQRYFIKGISIGAVKG